MGENGRGGYAWAVAANRSSRNDAVQDALARCSQHSERCRLTAQFQNLCYAIAEFKDGSVAWATAANTSEAHNKTLAECVKLNRNCNIVASDCDTVREEASVAEAPKAIPLADTLREQTRRAEARPLAVPLPNQNSKPSPELPMPVTTIEAHPPESAHPLAEHLPHIDRIMTWLTQLPPETFVVLAIIGALALFANSDVTVRPVAPFSTEIIPVDNKIYLKVRRSQRTTFLLRRPIFMLDARADVSPETRHLINHYQLNRLVIYDSKARTSNAEQALAHFNDAANLSYQSGASAIAKSFWNNARGALASARIALSLRVTVDKLLAGQHIECRDLNELIGTENAFVQACETLRTYLEVATTFDGREDLLEF